MKFALLAKWFNAVTDAWNRGEADWAYVEGISVTMRMYNHCVSHYPDRHDQAFVDWLVTNNISLKRINR